MKSKILLILCLALAAVAAFASCEDEGGAHTHQFSKSWTTNETHHWYAAICEHGENKQGYAEHTDADEDGICDECAYEMGHTHTFGDVWQSDDDYHWLPPTCSHTNEQGSYAQHADDDKDGECDVCQAHVHVENIFGVCGICGEQLDEIKNDDPASVIGALLARKDSVTGGTVEYSFTGINKNENTIDVNAHTVEFSIGTNGTYTKWTENPSGTAIITENWLKLVGAQVSGVTRVTTGGVPGEITNGTFTTADLAGYYYTVSSIADAHGAEEILAAVYELATLEGAENVIVTYDATEKKFAIAFDYTFVNKLEVTGRDEEGNATERTTVYKVHYYKIAMQFSYSEGYNLNDLKIVCQCYTDDAGEDAQGNQNVADIDLDYDPTTGKVTLRDGAAPDTYIYNVTQTHGERTEIDLDPAESSIPSSFYFYRYVAQQDGTILTVVLEDTLTLAAKEDGGYYINIGATPEGTNVELYTDNLTVTVTDSNGNEVAGFVEVSGAYMYLTPRTAGEYTLTASSSGIVKTVVITVTAS